MPVELLLLLYEWCGIFHF